MSGSANSSRHWPLRRLAAAWVTVLTVALTLLLLGQVLRSADRDAWATAHQHASNEAARLAVATATLVRRDPSVLAEMLAHGMLNPSIERLVVVDPQRRVALSSDTAETGQLLQLAQPGLLPLLPEALAADRLVEREETAARRLAVARALHWPADDGQLRGAEQGAVFVEVDVGRLIDANRRDGLQNHLTEFGVLLAASALLLVGLDRLIARPLDRLREAAVDMGGGNLAHRVPPTYVREVHEAGAAINRMGESLQASMQGVIDSEQRFRALTESAPDAIITLGEDGRVEQFNGAAERLFGYRADELVGQRLDVLMPPDAAQRHAELVAAFASEPAFSGRRMQMGRMVMGRHRDGRLLHLEVGISRSRTRAGLSFTAMIRDVSDRVAVEQELDVNRRQLEDQVRQRTAELIQERDRAQAAMRAKNEFLARMSHEIRTPMNAVVGLAHVVRRGAQPSQVNQLQTLEDSALQLLSLVDDILEFTRLEAGQVALLAAPADPRALVHAVCQPLALRAAKLGVEVVTWVDADVPDSVSLDAQRVRQLLGHLVDNAVKFTQAGHVTVHVSLCAAGLRFEVRDTGIGMSAESLAQLFKPFEQADPGDARRFGGVGLGLVITQRLLRLMGAELGASSQPGQGTSFHFELRAPAVQQRHSAPRAAVSARQVLVVDANADARAALLSALRHLGVPAEGAASAEEAERSLGRLLKAGREVDLCLVDARLLPTNFDRFLRRPDGADVPPDLRCVLTVLEGQTPPLAQVLRAGFLGVLSKPESEEALREKLVAWLALPASARPALRAPPVEAPAPAEPPAHGPMEGIQGLDSAAGLRTMRGDMAAYQRLLRRFVDFHAGDPSKLRELADAGQGRLVADLAHSLKSSAGAIGALEVVATASSVPRSGEPLAETQAAARALAQQLDAVLEGVRRAGGARAVEPAAQPSADAQLPVAELRRELRARLQRRDMAALRLIHGDLGAALAHMGPMAARLRAAVEDFDFDVALTLLDEWDAKAG